MIDEPDQAQAVTEQLWPGSSDGACPSREYRAILPGPGWDMEYHVERICRFGGLEWVSVPDEEELKLTAMTCPSCRTKFKVGDLPP